MIRQCSVNRILTNLDNAARGAGIVASAQRASSDIRLQAQRRAGGGRMVLTGPFAGDEDALIDVEVLSGTGGALAATRPVVRGVGNGTLDVVAIKPAAQPEVFSFALLDAGTPDEPALLEFFGSTLAARTPGAGSNALRVDVLRNLAATALPFATLETISAGVAEFDGPQWDWGQPAASGAGIPEGALRFQFEGFPTVHRAWKVWESGRFLYKLDPPPPHEVPADSRVLAVTGDYTLTVSDGVVSETYHAITIYDFLTAIDARSALAAVRGAIAADRSPGGMAVTDIPLRTDAHSLPAQIKTRAETRVEVGTVLATAPTENLTLKYAGGGAWGVSGAVSGTLPAARTGELYTHGPASFTVRRKASVGGALAARITGKYTPTSRSDADPGLPAICFKPLALGAKATDKTITFTWTKRPPAECFCDNLPALRLSAECLGLDIGGAEMALDAEHQNRLVALYAWYAEFTGSNTGIDTIPSSYSLTPSLDSRGATKRIIADPEALRLADAAVAEFYEGLEDVYASLDGRTQWDAYFAALDTLLSDVEGLASDDDIANVIKVENLTTGRVHYASSLSARIEAAIGFFKQRWAAQMDHCRVVSGVLPKSTAGSDAGACWRDIGATHWWADDDGFYLPVFNNVAYVSAIKTDEGQILSTQEFGFGIVTQCEHRLKEGDTITITVSGTANAAEYAEDDTIVIPIIAAASAPFVGGKDGDTTQTWAVRGSVSGALADWAYDPEVPTDYDSAALTARLLPGGIPFEVGDVIDIGLEGGRVRWRRDGGAWDEGDLYASHALGDGLTLSAQAGVAPSFVTGDSWTYRAVATYGVSRMRQPRIGEHFAWDGADVVIDVTLPAPVKAEALMLGLHTLPESAAIEISGGLLGATEWTVQAAWRAGPVLALLPEGEMQRVRVSISNAGAGAGIGWLWLGTGWRPTVGASDLTIVRQYGLARGQGLNPAALYRGRGDAGRWVWNLDAGAMLEGSNADDLMARIDYVAAQGLEPVCLLPDVRVPKRAMLAILDTDQVAMSEQLNFNAEGVRSNAVSVELPFRAVLT